MPSRSATNVTTAMSTAPLASFPATITPARCGVEGDAKRFLDNEGQNALRRIGNERQLDGALIDDPILESLRDREQCRPVARGDTARAVLGRDLLDLQDSGRSVLATDAGDQPAGDRVVLIDEQEVGLDRLIVVAAQQAHQRAEEDRKADPDDQGGRVFVPAPEILR